MTKHVVPSRGERPSLKFFLLHGLALSASAMSIALRSGAKESPPQRYGVFGSWQQVGNKIILDRSATRLNKFISDYSCVSFSWILLKWVYWATVICHFRWQGPIPFIWKAACWVAWDEGRSFLWHAGRDQRIILLEWETLPNQLVMFCSMNAAMSCIKLEVQGPDLTTLHETRFLSWPHHYSENCVAAESNILLGKMVHVELMEQEPRGYPMSQSIRIFGTEIIGTYKKTRTKLV